jgi:hypothetical protein
MTEVCNPTTDPFPSSEEPRPGPHRPTSGLVERRPGSVRRTVSTDMLRPGGAAGPVQLRAVGRDLRTGPTGRAEVIGQATLRAVVDFPAQRQVVAIETEPARPELQSLIGARAATGWRTRVDEAVPDERDRRSLLYLLLDDLPVTTLISGYAMGAAGFRQVRTASTRPPTPNLCAGWQEGGTMMISVGRTQMTPVPHGPPALPLVSDDDLGWHEMERVPAGGMRRARRLDLCRAADGLHVDAMFRDSHFDQPEGETVVHEYVLTAILDPADLTIRAIDADARVLPWLECPQAVASAGRLVGRSAHELRSLVRRELTGVSTCTHLNDLLRSLEDVVGLASLV